MTYRVVQCFTGTVGSAIIRLASTDPRIEIVGLYVHHEAKEGRDAGELAGIAPIGVKATCDLGSLLEAGADCAIWSGPCDAEPIGRILRSGVNVYSGNHAYYLHGEPDYSYLQDACMQGQVTLAAGGNIPGLISDVVPLFLSGYTSQIKQLRMWQRNHVPNIPSEEDLVTGVGFGRPCDDDDEPSKAIDRGWEGALRQSARMVADALGVPLDRFALTEKHIAPAPEDLHLESSGVVIRRGTAAGIRRLYVGTTGGRPFYQVNVEMTVALGLGPGWRSSAEQPNWRIEIDGSPGIIAEMAVMEPVGPNILELNASRAINSVPRVVEAAPGCRSVFDFPMATGGGHF